MLRQNVRTVVTTPDQFQAMMAQLRQASALALDFETSGLSWWAKARPVGLATACWVGDVVHSWYVPWGHDTLESQLPFEMISADLRWLFENEQQLKVLHNLKFDEHHGRVLGWRLRGQRYDTMLAARLYDENNSAALKLRAVRDLGLGWARDAEKEQDKVIARLARRSGLGLEDYKGAWGYSQVPLQICGPYACLDAEFALLLHAHYENWGVSKRFPRIWSNEMILTEVLCDMEENGMLIDLPYLDWLKSAVTYDKRRLESEIAVLLTHQGAPVFDLGSDEQLIAYMQRNLGLTLFHRTDKGHLSVGRETLKYWEQASPVLPKILEWRDADKVDTTYTTSLLKFVDKKGVLHTNFQQAGTNTGRLSCRQPNFQNIPADGGTERSVRRLFITRPGTVRLYHDYSQIELRVLTFFCRDPILLDAYATGQDIHTRTSLEIFGTDAKAMRRLAKIINFGLCVAEGQPVLTNVGLIPIERVRCWHLVWDGLEWVQHDGVVCLGEREVITHDGLTTTPEHEVYLADGRKVPIGEFASQVCAGQLAVGEIGGHPVRYDAFDRAHRAAKAFASVRGSDLLSVWAQSVAADRQRAWRQEQELHLPEEVWGSSCLDFGAALRRYRAAVFEEYAQVLASLQGAGDSESVSGPGAFCQVGPGDVPGYGFQGFGLRQDRQQRALQPGQSASHHPGRERPQRRQMARVYDLLNAGPRHRFTVAGKVVSNCYGMGPQGFARNAKISEEEAKAYLDKFFQRYAGINFYRESFLAQVRRNGCQFNNPWGRPRRIPWLNSPDKRVRSRAQRQAMGSLVQGTAAELTRESLVRIWRWIKQTGVKAEIVNTVHDEIQTDTEFGALVVTARKVKELMEDFTEIAPVPVLVSGEYATHHWGEKKDLPPLEKSA